MRKYFVVNFDHVDARSYDVRTFYMREIETDEAADCMATWDELQAALGKRKKPVRIEKPTIHVAGTVPQKLRGMRGGISAKQLAPILGVSAVTIYRMAERQGIPSYRLGTKLLFDPTRIADWLEN